MQRSELRAASARSGAATASHEAAHETVHETAHDVQQAYDRRSAEYAERLGTMVAVHPADRALVEHWADGVTGTVLDAGCGPGHWSDHLRRRGVDVRGIDLSPRFVEHARAEYPDVAFTLGSLEAIPEDSASLGGILAWYSLIHMEPSRLGTVLNEFARVLRPGGVLLLGFFDGPDATRFDHAVISARTWSVSGMARQLEAAGFDVVETHRRTGPGYRPHAAITALRRS